jgi:hypothetical protein
MTIEDVLRRATGVLHEIGTPWSIVGGWAVSVHTEPRFTRDVDLADAVKTDDEAQSVINAFLNRGYRIVATV